MYFNQPKISSFSIILVFLCISLAGIALVPLLPVKLAPSQNLPALTVSFSMPGSASRVVEMEATSKIEAMLSRIKGIKKITSRSGNGWGSVSLEMDKHTSIDVARFEASTVIRQLWGDLPRSVSYPQLQVRRPDENANRPFLNYTLNASAPPITIQNYCENSIKPRLSEIEGIYKVDVNGATPMEWQLQYDNDQLNRMGVSVDEIQRAIQLHYNTQFLGIGEIEDSGNVRKFARVVLGDASEKETFDASKISVTNKDGKILYLNQLVNVSRVEQAPRSYYRINGLNSIYISISAEENANQLQLSSEIKKLMEDIRKNLPQGYELHQSYDATEYIKDELNKIYFRSGLTILILLAFVLLISRNFKYLFLIVSSLFINLAIAVVLYYFLRLEIQLYSLAGITISLNLMIDNTIIMTDHLQTKNNRKVFLPILAATLTTIGALCMIFFLDERLRLNLQDFAMVIVINLAVSLLVALFFVPAMMERIKIANKTRKSRQKFRISKRFIVKTSLFYQKIILLLKKGKWAVYVFFILLFGLPVFLLPDKIDKETRWAELYNSVFNTATYKEKIKPITDKVFGGTLRLFVQNVYERGYFDRNQEMVLTITSSMPNGTTLSQMNTLVQRMESYLSTFSEIKQFQTSINSPNRASISVYFTKEAERSGFPYRLKNSVITKALELGGGSWGVFGLEDRGFSNDVKETAGSFSVKLLGYNYDELNTWADSLKNNLLKHRRIQEVTIGSDMSYYKDDYQEFMFNLDKKQLAIQNMSPSRLFNSLSSMFGRDIWVGRLFVDGQNEDIVLHSKQSKTYDIWALQHAGNHFDEQFHKLNQFAQITKGQAPQEIAKENQQYRLVVQFNYIGSSQQGNKVLEKEIEKLNNSLPSGYKAEKQGWNWNWGKDKKQYWLLGLLIAIIFFTTSILFNSLKQPFIVILIIPISFIGVFLTFYSFDLNFDQGGFASFVLLSGITVNANIYILNEYNGLRKKYPNLSSVRAYLKAWNSKIIPILLTIISTILGFIPFVIGLKREAFWFPLAAGTMGGLLFSLVGIFILLPMLVVKRK
ncbi:efflux RND transporter permease subunit [Capnocytophaga canis]|uniref:efflux RND transporter permease subunit n=1 Tax=Capnocytophaga canis TaxID=1848903 RepID=UPI00156265D0|nr:efflux RND transporter permease subunit [Capnocytophaga canis]